MKIENQEISVNKLMGTTRRDGDDGVCDALRPHAARTHGGFSGVYFGGWPDVTFTSGICEPVGASTNFSVDSRSLSAAACGVSSCAVVDCTSAIIRARSSSDCVDCVEAACCGADSNVSSASAATFCSVFRLPISDVGFADFSTSAASGWCSKGSTGGAFLAASSAIIASTCSSVSSVMTTVDSEPECSSIHLTSLPRRSQPPLRAVQ